jgi:hypothetical protein
MFSFWRGIRPLLWRFVVILLLGWVAYTYVFDAATTTIWDFLYLCAYGVIVGAIVGVIGGVIVGVIGVGLVIQFEWARRKLKLASRTRRFLTASGGRVVLRYAPDLQGRADPQEVLALAEKTLGELEATFGPLASFWPRARSFRGVCVYLFSSCEGVQAVCGSGAGGRPCPTVLSSWSRSTRRIRTSGCGTR